MECSMKIHVDLTRDELEILIYALENEAALAVDPKQKWYADILRNLRDRFQKVSDTTKDVQASHSAKQKEL
jgi:hypothetical protein